QEREHERRGLAAAGVRGHQQVATRQRGRDRGLLDRSRLGVAGGTEGIEHRRADAQVGKTHQEPLGLEYRRQPEAATPEPSERGSFEEAERSGTMGRGRCDVPGRKPGMLRRTMPTLYRVSACCAALAALAPPARMHSCFGVSHRRHFPGASCMPAHPSANLRTLAFVGHAGVGKTTLIEALLAANGTLASPGTIERGSTVCDYDPLEKEHGQSLKVACTHFERDGVRVHLLDTPGYPDFA